MSYIPVRELPDGTLMLCENSGLDVPDYMQKTKFPYQEVKGVLVDSYETKHRRMLAPTLREVLSQIPENRSGKDMYVTTKFSLKTAVTKIFRPI
mgnify:CR=1 FL=1